MTKYDKTIQKLNSIKSSLDTRLREIKSAASVSYNSWDSDTRNAYQSAINNITNEISRISSEISNLKRYVYKEDE